MVSDRLEAELARLLGEIAALVRREARAEPQAGQPGGAEGEAERLRAALGATADRLAHAAARFERLGLDAAAATVRLVERGARDELRKLRPGRHVQEVPGAGCLGPGNVRMKGPHPGNAG